MAEYFECPECGEVSYSKKDIQEGYCGRCHDWTGEKAPRPEPLDRHDDDDEREIRDG